MPNAYVCQRAVGPRRECDFRTGRTILQRTIEPEQVRKLLATGRTDLITRFISKKGRAFNAFLVRQPNGSVGFEFEKRERAPPRGKTAAAVAPGTAKVAGSPRRRAARAGEPESRPGAGSGRAKRR
jgi:DNA topoisomerase-3